MKRTAFFLLSVLMAMAVNAQMRINMGEDSPIRKMMIAQMAIENLYVDSVDNCVKTALEQCSKSSTHTPHTLRRRK